jgi:hypothetical protein
MVSCGDLVIAAKGPGRTRARSHIYPRADSRIDCGDQSIWTDGDPLRRSGHSAFRTGTAAPIARVALRSNSEGRIVGFIDLFAAVIVGRHLELQRSAQTVKIDCAARGADDGHRDGFDFIAGAATTHGDEHGDAENCDQNSRMFHWENSSARFQLAWSQVGNFEARNGRAGPMVTAGVREGTAYSAKPHECWVKRRAVREEWEPDMEIGEQLPWE